MSASTSVANVSARDWLGGGVDGQEGGPAAAPGNWPRDVGNPPVPEGKGGPAGGCSDMKRWYRRLSVSVFTIAMLHGVAWEHRLKPNDVRFTVRLESQL
jgi:hypothetical protein